MTREEAEVSPYKNVILQAMGQRPNLMVALGHIELRRNDIFLLCSDGLSGKLKDEEMYDIVTGARSFKEAARKLVDIAKERGGEDNITVVLAHVSGDGVAEPPVGERVTETLKNVQEYDPTVAAALQAAKPAAPQAAPPPKPARPIPAPAPAPPSQPPPPPPPPAPPVASAAPATPPRTEPERIAPQQQTGTTPLASEPPRPISGSVPVAANSVAAPAEVARAKAAPSPRRRLKLWYLIPIVIFLLLFLTAATLFLLEYTGVTDWFIDDIDELFD
jgi:hypothetical protein